MDIMLGDESPVGVVGVSTGLEASEITAVTGR